MDGDAVITPEINVEIRIEPVDSEDVCRIARGGRTEAAACDRIKVVFRLGSEYSRSFSTAESNDPGRRVVRADEHHRIGDGCLSNTQREFPFFALCLFWPDIRNRGIVPKRRSCRYAD